MNNEQTEQTISREVIALAAFVATLIGAYSRNRTLTLTIEEEKAAAVSSWLHADRFIEAGKAIAEVADSNVRTHGPTAAQEGK